jgi:hypothetical protein
VISHACYDENDVESKENFNKLRKEDFAKIERHVEHEMGLSRGDILFDLPDLPNLMGTAKAVVEIAPGKTLLLENLYPTAAWAAAFAGFRKVAYVFTTAEDRRRVGTTVRGALASLRYPVKLNEFSLVLAKN